MLPMGVYMHIRSSLKMLFATIRYQVYIFDTKVWTNKFKNPNQYLNYFMLHESYLSCTHLMQLYICPVSNCMQIQLLRIFANFHIFTATRRISKFYKICVLIYCGTFIMLLVRYLPKWLHYTMHHKVLTMVIHGTSLLVVHIQ